MTLLDYFVIAIIFVLIAFGGFERYQIDQLKIASIVAINNQKDADIQSCNNSTQPAAEADTYDKTHSDAQLNACLSELQLKSNAACVQPAAPANGTHPTPHPNTTITYYQIAAHNIQCQHAVDDLNSAKIWAKGYQKLRDSK